MPTPIELGPFTEGVNLVDPPTKLTPNELSQCSNLRTGVRGNFYKRPGHGNYGSTPTKVNGDFLVNFLCRYYKGDGTKKLIAAANGALFQGNDSSGLWTGININGTGAVMSAINLCDFMVYKDRLYITDGLNIQRWNGTDDVYAGHFVYIAPTYSSQSAGGGTKLTLLGVYKYLLTSIAGTMGEGIGGSILTCPALTGSNNQINLTIPAAASTKYEETARRLYRTKANGSIFYVVADVSPGAYLDTMPDSSLGTEYVSVHAPRNDSKFVIQGHDERTYWFGRQGVNASIVEVSDIGFPDRVLDNSFFPVSNNDGDILQGGGLTPGGIVLFKRNSTWLSRGYGFGLTNIAPKDKHGAGLGTTSPFSIVATPIGLIFVSQRGEIYLFDGTNLTEIGRRVFSEFRNMPQAARDRIVACYHDYRYIISYDYRGTKGYNWKTLEYDTIQQKWEGPHENGDFYNPSYYSVWDSVLDFGELYWGESKPQNGSYVYQRSEFTKTDRGRKFTSRMKTGARADFASLGEVASIKAFVHGDFSSDAELQFSHLDKVGARVSAKLNIPVQAASAKFNSNYEFKLIPPNIGKTNGIWGGRTSDVSEANLEPCRSRTPIYEISDGGSATEINMNIIQLLANGLPLK